MTKEQNTIFETVCSLIHRQPLQLSTIANWNDVFRTSVELGVPAVVFDVLANSIYGKEMPKPVKVQWFAWQREVEHDNLKLNKVLYKVCSLFSVNDLPFVLLKGQGLAVEYPVPERRNCGDIDLYVGANVFERAREILAEEGWLQGNSVHEDLKHLEFSVDGVMIELHYYAAIIPGRIANENFQLMTANALEQAHKRLYVTADGKISQLSFGGEMAGTAYADGVFIPTFPLAENTVFTFIHLFGHFITGGISLRQIIDWAMLVRKIETADFDAVKTKLQRVGHLKAWQVFACVLTRYFGFAPADIPAYNEQYEQKAEFVLQLILNDSQKAKNVNQHAAGIRNKCRELMGMTANFRRVFLLFPSECLSYTARLISNTFIKYRSLANGKINR